MLDVYFHDAIFEIATLSIIISSSPPPGNNIYDDYRHDAPEKNGINLFSKLAARQYDMAC